MTTWQISPGAQRLELKDGRGEVVFTVSNPGPVDRRATVEIVGSDQAQGSWFTVPEPQQVIPLSGSKQFTVIVEPDEKAPAGAHWLAGRVYSADAAPEEDSVISDRVTFEIKPPAERPKTKSWLWALIAGTVSLVVVVGVVLFLVLKDQGPEVPDVTTMKQADAEQLIKDRGLVPKVQQKVSATVEKGRVISQDPRAETSVEFRSEVALKVSRGPLLEGEVEVPTFIGVKMGNIFNAIVEIMATVFSACPAGRGGFTLEDIMAGKPRCHGQPLQGITMEQLAVLHSYRLGLAVQGDPPWPSNTDTLDPALSRLVVAQQIPAPESVVRLEEGSVLIFRFVEPD